MQTVGILVFDDVEILDFSGPYEVFSTAARVRRRQGAEDDAFRCMLFAEDMRPIRTRGGMQVQPDRLLSAPDAIELQLIPGGDVSGAILRPSIIEWIGKRHAAATLTASVCTGAFLLAQAGLLDGLAVTTHWEDLRDLQAAFPALRVVGDRPWVDCGKVVTSAGISAGIDMSLHLVARLAGAELALATARQMEYRWNMDGTDEPGDASAARLLPVA